MSGGNEIAGLAIALCSRCCWRWSSARSYRAGAACISLLTLACSQIAFEIAFKWTSFTGGENGLQHVNRPLFPSAFAFHVFALVVILGVLALAGGASPTRRSAG